MTFGDEATWTVSAPILQPGPTGTFDEVAVKDPSVVFAEGQWHLFYTARSKQEYTIGYAAAKTLEGLAAAERHPLKQIRGGGSVYAAAPQVFFFAPQELWYMIFQSRDTNYQPMFSTTTTIGLPESWSIPEPLVKKNESAKWIDFWVLCDEERAYLYYTRNHRDVYSMDTAIADFPEGFGTPRNVFSTVHEAVHVYKVKDKEEYHMICEYQEKDMRHFGLAVAPHPAGPWTMANEEYATGQQLRFSESTPCWTVEVSHGEALRSGCDQRLEYDAEHTQLLIQGLPEGKHKGPYEMLPWSLGVIELNKSAK